MPRAVVIALPAGLVALLFSSGAAAQTFVDQPSVSGVASTGPIEVGGVQSIICGATFDRASASVNLTEAASQDVGVAIECNTRFQITARSTFGELRRESGYDGGDSRTFLPYSVAWPSNLLDSAGVPIASNFSAPGSAWAQGIMSNNAPTRLAQAGTMTISWQAAQNLLAGDYRDTFVLNIEPN